jgi:hypothetical protein
MNLLRKSAGTLPFKECTKVRSCAATGKSDAGWVGMCRRAEVLKVDIVE